MDWTALEKESIARDSLIATRSSCDYCGKIETSKRHPRIEVIDRQYAAILAAKTPAQRMSMVFEMHRTAKMLAEAGVRYLHPDWTDDQIRTEAVKRLAYGAK